MVGIWPTSSGTGSRKAAIPAMHIAPRSISGGHVDAIQGLLHRKPVGKVL